MTPLDARRTTASPATGRRSRLVRIAFRLLTLLVPLALLILVTEIGIRLTVPPERWRVVDATHNWQLDPLLGWVNGSNLDSYF